MPWSVGDVEKHNKGLSDKQKKRWVRVANSVRAKCLADGGSESSCDASAIRQANGVVSNETFSEYNYITNQKEGNYQVKKAKFEGKNFLVVPVTMMVEGVHNGNHGPLLHTIKELGKFPESWNGIPIVIYHPEKEGQAVSANSPDILEEYSVGKTFNTKVDGIKLKAEAWFDPDKLKRVSEETLDALNEGKELEVSVGVFTEEEEEEGIWNGETYEAIAVNHRPDHLAILPNAVGACSIEDGCGLGVNEEKRPNVKGYALHEIGNNKDEGYKERLDAAYNAISMLSTSESYYLEELYDDELIYCVYNKEGSKMYKQGYKFESGEIELVGSPVEVHREVAFVVNSNHLTKEDKKMSDNKCPNCVKKIEALLANKESGFVEADREWLDTLTETALDKIAPKVIEKTVEKTIEVNKLAPEDQAALAFGKKQMKERHENWIRGIQENTEKGVWKDEKLTVMDDDTLESIFKSVYKEKEVTNYGLLGGGIIHNEGNEVEPLYPAGVEVK